MGLQGRRSAARLAVPDPIPVQGHLSEKRTYQAQSSSRRQSSATIITFLQWHVCLPRADRWGSWQSKSSRDLPSDCNRSTEIGTRHYVIRSCFPFGHRIMTKPGLSSPLKTGIGKKPGARRIADEVSGCSWLPLSGLFSIPFMGHIYDSGSRRDFPTFLLW